MMARRGQHRRWSAAIVLLLMCANISESSPASTSKPDLGEKQCPAEYFLNKKGTCCNRCHAGFRLKSECEGEGQRSVCEQCPERQYNDQINHASTCRSCRTCKDSRNEHVISSCSTKQNAVCACNDGYYKHHIDSETYECLKCTTCGENEQKKQNCTREGDAVCECKKNYHRVKKKCEPCSNCTPDCAQYCENTQPKVSVGPTDKNTLIVNIIAGSVVVVVVLVLVVGVITFMATKRFTKNKMLSPSSKPADVSTETKEHLLINIIEPAEVVSLKTPGPSPQSEQELSKLPDCVLLEIWIADLIYTVLDLVPVSQVKQLVRSLGVRDTEIEHAEMDHRSSREAHYQMMRVWAQRSVQRGRGEMLHRPLLEELLDKLRLMHLGWAAEELETKYTIQ